MTVHGGDVWQVAEELGTPAPELLDFSANINPRGLPPRAMQRLARDASNVPLLSLYPDPSARHLRRPLSEQAALPAAPIVASPRAAPLPPPFLPSLPPPPLFFPFPPFRPP